MRCLCRLGSNVYWLLVVVHLKLNVTRFQSVRNKVGIKISVKYVCKIKDLMVSRSNVTVTYSVRTHGIDIRVGV